jgi:hypothetical protein
MLTRSYAITLGARLFLVTAAFGQPPISTPLLPPVGLAATETAQVNVVNSALPVPGGLEPFCSGTIVFYGGASGQTVLGNVAAFQVRPGEVFSAALPFSSTGATASRTVIRVAITLSAFTVPTAAGPQVTPCSLVSSIETYDTVTGVTHAYAFASAIQDATNGQPAKSPTVR